MGEELKFDAQQLNSIIEGVADYLKLIGLFAYNIGLIKQQYPIVDRLNDSPETMDSFIGKAPAAVLAFILKGSAKGDKLQRDMNKMSSAELMEFGNDLINFANSEVPRVVNIHLG